MCRLRRCVDACPGTLSHCAPQRQEVYGGPCASHDKGPVVRQACDNGCIGCKICVKACPKEGAIVVENFLAKINYDICIGCGMCSQACPWNMPRVDSETGVSTKCISCGRCAEQCPNGAIKFIDGRISRRRSSTRAS